MEFKQWEGFNTQGEWTKEIDVRGFIQANYTPYEGNDDFLVGATEKTQKLWNNVTDLYKQERENGDVLDVDVKTPSGKVLRFVEKRGEIGVHTAYADAGYDLSKLNKGVFSSGKVGYKNENLIDKGG